MIFEDVETCGLHGMAVLIQYAEDDGEVQLFSPWGNPIYKTLELIEWMINHKGGLCGFNLAFDFFHLIKLYTVFNAFPDHNVEPIDYIDEIAKVEPLGRDGPCLKPVTAFDIMLHARKGPYQSTMDRSDIRIKKVPTALAWVLADELEKRVQISNIYFAKRKDKYARKWQVKDIEDEYGEINTDFKDLVLAFRPSSALKALAKDALKIDETEVLLYGDVDLNDYPEEIGYAPFALAVGQPGNWKNAWPAKIRVHHNHWQYHERARRYAADDVKYTRALYNHFGRPEMGDVDSILACMVAAVRWKGFRVDVEGLQALRDKTIKSKTKIVNGEVFNIPTAPSAARYYISELMSPTERLGANSSIGANIEITTKKVLLQDISKWKIDCNHCNDENTNSCTYCGGTGELPHPSAERAAEVLAARQADYEVDLYDKFLLALRFHASLNVIGALSSRMSGTDGLNAQGIKKTKEVRSKFPLFWPGDILCGGDFAGFEVTIAEAVYKDENLRKQLLTCEMCSSQMVRINEATPIVKFLHGEATKLYIKWRLKAEAKQKAKDSKYKEKTEEQILGEIFENDFICPNCGSNEGKKIHALFGIHVYPEHTYETLKATSGTKNDLYTKAKSAIFSMFYGGTIHTLMDRLGVSEEVATKALAAFHREFPGVRRFQQDIYDSFCSMRQPGGIGSKVEWHDPADFRETMFGFRRYFTLENQICKILFNLANKPPTAWKDIKIKVQRRERVQTAMGAVQSALYAAAFAIQGSNMRAAANHDIQSAGATITKTVQKNLWAVQPAGVHEWIVQPLNIHDEIQCPVKPGYEEQVKKIVMETVESMRPKVPLIKMDWQIGLNSWADKS